MQVSITGTACTVRREAHDPKFYNESTLLHHIKHALNRQGHDFIKKPMWRDGHMVADTQHYLRTRKPQPGQLYAIWDDAYALRFLHTDYNAGRVTLTVEYAR